MTKLEMRKLLEAKMNEFIASGGEVTKVPAPGRKKRNKPSHLSLVHNQVPAGTPVMKEAA